VSDTTQPQARTVGMAVLSQMRRDILNGTFAPGSQLRFEALRLAYGASFSTFREALSYLVGEGLVRAEGQRGFKVIRLTRPDLYDLYDSWIVVERAAIAQALPRGDGAWEAKLRLIRERYESDAAQGEEAPWLVQLQAQQASLDAIAAPCASPTMEFLRQRLAIRSLHYWQAGRHFGVEPPRRAHDFKGLLQAALRRDIAATADRVEAILRADVAAFDAHADALWQMPEQARPRTDKRS